MKKWYSLFFVLTSFLFVCTFVNALSDLQITACDAASEHGTCDKLDELGLVTKAQCCSGLGKCCGTTTCPNGVCAVGENCPADKVSCTDTKCYEPTCANGCGKVVVDNGQTDEACYGSIGCTDGSCTCDGNGNCISGLSIICGDGVCATSENCPQDVTGCSSSYDTKCYEPTCANGCGQVAVTSGLTDESCYGSVGCTEGNCTCDGVGSCFSRTPTCPDGVCATGENCPADANKCTDTKCYEPTCANGCGKVVVDNGQTDEACYGSIGCTDGSCTCDGNGNCISTTIQCKTAGQLCSITSECCSGLTCDNDQCTIVSGCSFDNNCVKCGNSCIPYTQWDYSCASPTIDFDCKCVNGECVYISAEQPEVTKTILPDCTIHCVNQDGCVCSSNCKKTGDIDYGETCSGENIPGLKEVGLCDGCVMNNDTCLDVGVQKQTSEGGSTYYCNSDKKLGWVKTSGEVCNNDYECLSYTCKGGTCIEKREEKETSFFKTNFKRVVIVGLAIIISGLVFLAFKLFTSHKTLEEEEKKIEKKGFEIQEPEQKYSYKYKPEFDVLEKKLKESLGKIKK